MPAYGWLQRVRHNTYTVCYVRLVADHHLLVVPHSPRPAHLIRTVILHNCSHAPRDERPIAAAGRAQLQSTNLCFGVAPARLLLSVARP